MDNQQLHAVLLPNGTVELEWGEVGSAGRKSSSLLEREIETRFEQDASGWLFFLGFTDGGGSLSSSLSFWRAFASLFARGITRTPGLELLRDKAEVDFPRDSCADLLGQAPLMAGSEYLNLVLLENLWKRMNQAFRTGIQSYKGSVEEFLHELSPHAHLVGRVFFHLVENKKGKEPFAFLATYSTQLGKGGREKHVPLKFALQEYRDDREKLLELLATVQAASVRSELVAQLMDTGELFHPLGWSSGEAFTFLKEVPVYEECGILCRIPDWWKGARGGVRLNISVGDTQPSLVGAGALLGFNVAIALGDESFSLEEGKALLEQAEGLVFIKNKWVAVDPDKLGRTIAALEKAQGIARGYHTVEIERAVTTVYHISGILR